MLLKRPCALFATVLVAVSALFMAGPADATFDTGTGAVALRLSAPVAGSALVE